jgi:hypothetical protein
MNKTTIFLTEKIYVAFYSLALGCGHPVVLPPGGAASPYFIGDFF